METVRLFGLLIPLETLHPPAAEPPASLDDVDRAFDALGAGYEKAKDVLIMAGLEGKVDLHVFYEGNVSCVFFILARSERDPYSDAPRMPVGREPKPSKYKRLRELLNTEQLGHWREFDREDL